jgi:hypothetical protein
MAAPLSPKEKLPDRPEDWGIRIEALRLTAADHFLDLRFRVVDPVKAAAILTEKNKAFVIDQKSGTVLPVPVTKTGSLRQFTAEPLAGRVYFILFTNPPGLVRHGDKVTVRIGEFKKRDIIVEGTPGAAQQPNTEPPEMSPEQRKKWLKIGRARDMVLKDYHVCVEHCGQGPACLGRCKEAFESRLEREYQRSLHKE